MPTTLTTLRKALGALPSLAVFAALGALAYWGHHSDWKFPRYAELLGLGRTETEDWCALHNVPDSRCISCHPELGGTDPADWCKEHGLPESKCTLCHPDLLSGGNADWCPEHGLPEKSCTKCHPEIAVKSPRPPSPNGATVSAAEGSEPPKDPKTCQTHSLRVQFASAQAVRKAGIHLAAVQKRPMAAYLQASGEADYAQTRLARLASRTPGIARQVLVEVGQRVSQGQLLALVDSAETGRAKAEFLQARALTETKARLQERLRSSAEEARNLIQIRTRKFGRLSELVKDQVASRTDLEEAEADLSEARLQALGIQTQQEEAEAALREGRIRLFDALQALHNLGLPVELKECSGLADEELAEKIRLLGLPAAVAKNLDLGAATANLLPILAPFEGEVVACDVVAGEVLDTTRTLLVLADVSRMWIQLDVRQEDARSLALGQRAAFRPDGDPGEPVTGNIVWISSAADERTRTVRVRAEVGNPEGRLRAHTFGSGRITVRETPGAVAVPSEAIHWEGCCNIVFVRLIDDIFQTRKVKLGARNGPFTEVLNGLLPGEAVAATGSHVLKSEILRSALGAGCCAE